MSGITQIVGGILGSNAAGAAAKDIQAQDQKAIAGQNQQLQTTTNNLNPYMAIANAALPTYGSYYTTTQNVLGNQYQNAQNATNGIGTESLAQLEATPGYQFQLQQGQNAAKAAASALGLGNSGAIGKGLTNYANGLAANNYQNIYNQQLGTAQAQQALLGGAGGMQNTIFGQLSAPVTTGYNATNALAGYGQNTQNQISQLYGNIGQAQAGGAIQSANQIGGALNGAASFLNNGLFGQSSMPSFSSMGSSLSKLFGSGGGGSAASGGGAALDGDTFLA